MAMPNTSNATEDVAAALAQCACIHMRVASRVMTRLYDEALAPSGIRISQLATLSVLAFQGPFTVKALANALVMDRTTLTADLKPLETRGFLEIVPGKDRRTRVIAISKKGRKVLEAAIPAWQRAQEQVKSEFGEVRLQGLLHDLREVVSMTQPH
jgi:DNA-binding MarR family transcriptional regulator